MFVRNNPYGGHNLYEFIDGFMKTFPNAGGILINWLNFGSSHHEKRPEGGVLENFTMCAAKDFPVNQLTKFIGDPAKLLAMVVHNAVCRKNYYSLDEDGKIFAGRLGTKDVKFEKIRINHYFTKSREEFITKKDRGRADMLSIRDLKEFDDRDQNVCTDTEILSRR